MQITFDPDKLAKGTDTIQVEMVRDEVNNLIIEVSSWISQKTEGYISKLRTNIRLNQAKFTCFCCGYPVLLRKHKLGGHYFAHMEKTASEKANCLYQQPGIASIDDRNRIRYQGQREGERHIRTKNLIADIIKSDPNFSEIRIEAVWKTFQDGWRKPDVSAIYNGVKVVFEAQVSNTYPQIVAERTDFYRKQDSILIWIYDSINDFDWRTFHSDNFCSNGQHIFCVDDACLSISQLQKVANFKIYTQRPDVAPYQREDKKWLLELKSIKKYDLIPFSNIKIDTILQTATYFDISMEKWKAEHKILCSIAQADYVFEKIEESLRFIVGEKIIIKRETIEGWPVFICALESARLNKPIGTKHANIYGVFNLLYDHHPEFMLAFAEKIEEFGHTVQTASGAWKSRLILIKKGKYKMKNLMIEIPRPHRLVGTLLSYLY